MTEASTDQLAGVAGRMAGGVEGVNRCAVEVAVPLQPPEAAFAQLRLDDQGP